MTDLRQTGPAKFDDLLHEYRLLSQLLTSRDRIIMGRILPALDALGAKMKQVEKTSLENVRRLELLEAAVADLGSQVNPPPTPKKIYGWFGKRNNKGNQQAETGEPTT